MSIMQTVHLNRFKPRPYQIPIMDAILNKGYKRVLCILPRRAGKDVCAFNTMLRAALKKIGVYYYIFPTYSQGKKVIWDSITNSGERFLDYIPSELITAILGIFLIHPHSCNSINALPQLDVFPNAPPG